MSDRNDTLGDGTKRRRTELGTASSNEYGEAVTIAPADGESILETLQSAAGATGNGTAINVKGYRSVVLEVSGTFVATVTFEGTIDDSSWFAIGLKTAADATAVTTATAAGAFKLPADLTALSQIRARVSAFTSGTVTVKSRKHPR